LPGPALFVHRSAWFDSIRLLRDTRLVTRAVIIVALCGLALGVAPAGARQRQYAFLVTDASMSEVMTFQGDGGPACARAGVCGDSGTITYSFGGGDGLAAFVMLGRRAGGTSDLFYSGLTSATVQGPGGGPPCTDKVIRDFDGFEVEGKPSHIRVVFHPPIYGPNYLDTYCSGPSDLDMSHAHALPVLTLSERSLRRRSLHLQVSSARPFHAGPFVGTLTFQADIRMRRARHISSILQFLAGDL
jgi:hypothetical protein